MTECGKRPKTRIGNQIDHTFLERNGKKESNLSCLVHFKSLNHSAQMGKYQFSNELVVDMNL